MSPASYRAAPPRVGPSRVSQRYVDLQTGSGWSESCYPLGLGLGVPLGGADGPGDGLADAWRLASSQALIASLSSLTAFPQASGSPDRPAPPRQPARRTGHCRSTAAARPAAVDRWSAVCLASPGPPAGLNLAASYPRTPRTRRS